MKKTASDVLIERLISWDVEVIFGLPGDGINGIIESLRTHQEEIRFIQVRHEESAALPSTLQNLWQRDSPMQEKLRSQFPMIAFER
jgi:glyoxylate carboligase